MTKNTHRNHKSESQQVKNTCTSKNWKIKGKLKFLKLAVIFLEDPPLKKFAGIMLFLTSILTKGQMISSASVECIH